MTAMNTLSSPKNDVSGESAEAVVLIPRNDELRNYSLFPTLVKLELRKLIDTVASRWVVTIAVVLCCAIAVIYGIEQFHNPNAETLKHATLLGALSTLSTIPMSVIGMMGMTGDWASRNTHIYFPQVRSRSLIFWAKLSASLVASVILVGGLLLLTTIEMILLKSAGGRVVLDTDPQAVLRFVIIMVNSTLFGACLAAITRRLPVALTVVFALTLLNLVMLVAPVPTFLKLLSSSDTYLKPVLQALGAPTREVAAPDGTMLGVVASFLIWVVLPLIAGWWTSKNAEA